MAISEKLKKYIEEQWDKALRESHIKNRMGAIECEKWAKQRKMEQKSYVRQNLEQMSNVMFYELLYKKSDEEMWEIYTKLSEAESGSDKMKSSEILLSLDEHLEVFKNPDGVCVEYKNAEIKDGCFLVFEFGVGEDFESACDDYLNKIRGKKLVFNSCTSYRKEVTVLG